LAILRFKSVVNPQVFLFIKLKVYKNMPKTRQQKEQDFKELKERLDTAKAVVMCAFDKLDVNSDQSLRSELRQNEVSYKVFKKTLLKKAFEEAGIEGFSEDNLERNIALAAGQDEVNGAKILAKFAKGNENFQIVGGLLEKNWLAKEQVEALSKLPSKEELIAKTVGTIKAPITGFVNVLAGNMRGLVNALNAIKEQKA